MKTILILLSAIALCAADTNDPFFLNGNYITVEDAPLLSINRDKFTEWEVVTNHPGSFLSFNTNGITEYANGQRITWNHFSEPTSVTVASPSVTNVHWHFSDTNRLNLSTSLRNVTSWLTIDRITNGNQIVARQIGQVQTNRVLTLIYQGRTNHLIIGTEGKEQWPNQKRTNSEPIQIVQGNKLKERK